MSQINKVSNAAPVANQKPAAAPAPAKPAAPAGDQLVLSTTPKPVQKAEADPVKVFGKQLLLTGTLAGSAAIIGATVWSMASIPAIVAGALAIGCLGLLGWGLLRQPHAFD